MSLPPAGQARYLLLRLSFHVLASAGRGWRSLGVERYLFPTCCVPRSCRYPFRHWLLVPFVLTPVVYLIFPFQSSLLNLPHLTQTS